MGYVIERLNGNRSSFPAFATVLSLLLLFGTAYGAEAPGSSPGSLFGPSGHYGYLYASLNGNSGVSYTIDNVDPNTDYTILIVDTNTGAEEVEHEHSDEHGHFSGSHTMKNAFASGTKVYVALIQKKKVIDFVHLTVPGHAPWWAYTGVGTAIYFLF